MADGCLSESRVILRKLCYAIVFKSVVLSRSNQLSLMKKNSYIALRFEH